MTVLLCAVFAALFVVLSVLCGSESKRSGNTRQPSGLLVCLYGGAATLSLLGALFFYFGILRGGSSR
jgi:hypothetical protein